MIAPEFVRLVPGPEWLPILDAFQLMLIFTLLDPLKITVSHLFVAVGKPNIIVRARVVQLGVLIAGLFLLGLPLGIRGVALAVDVMLFIGIFMLLWQARDFVDFSLVRLFANPAIMLATAVTGTIIVGWATAVASDWLSLGIKTAAFSSIYLIAWFILERSQFQQALSALKTYWEKPDA
jgi:O-antigen/teichoic acid export membrane protein